MSCTIFSCVTVTADMAPASTVSRARDIAKRLGCDYLSVSATTGNVAAHRFYESMDFAPRPVTGMRYMQSIA